MMTPTKFKNARTQLGLSQAGLASALGLAKNGLRTIRRYELGERKIPGPVVLAIKYLLLIANKPDTRRLQARSKEDG